MHKDSHISDDELREIRKIFAEKTDQFLAMREDVKEIYSLKELADEEGTILDPYGKDLMDYEYCYRELDRLVEKWFLNKLVKP